MKTSRQIAFGSILSYVQLGLSVIIGLIYTPIMIRTLGTSEYGLYNTVTSTISMLAILSLGFNTSYIRYYSKYKKNSEEVAIEKLNGLYLIIFCTIGVVVLVFGLFLTFNLSIIFDQGLTRKEYDLAKVLALLLTINLTISFPMSVFQTIISAHEKYIFLKLVGVTRTVVAPLIVIPLLLLGFHSVAIVIVTIVISAATDITNIFYVKRVLAVKFRFTSFEKGLFKSLLIFTSFIAVNMIVDQVNSNMGKFLLGRFQGTTAVAVYSVGFTLYQYYITFSNAIAGVFAPKIHRIVNYTCEDHILQKEKLTTLFTKVGRLQFSLLMLLVSGFLFFGKPFIKFWAGVGFEESYYVALLLMVSSSIALIQNLGVEIQRAQNKHQFRSVAYIAMALINLLLTISLCQQYGATGAAIGTAVSLILANGLIMNVYYHKRCNINIIDFWKSISRISIAVIPPIGIGIVFGILGDIDSIFELVIGIIVYSLIYMTSLWLCGFNSYEKQLFKSLWEGVIGKFKFIR